MPWNVSRNANTVKKEILKFPAGLDAIESVVLCASGAPALGSAVTGSQETVYGYRAGTVLKAITGDGAGRYTAYNGSGTPAGVLGDNVYFYDHSDASDEGADMLFHGVVFNENRLSGGYSGHETTVKSALSTCKFLPGDDW